MNNKGKIKYFSLGLLVATLWFLVLGGIILLISSIGFLHKGKQIGAVTDQNVEKMTYFQELLQTYYYEDVPKSSYHGLEQIPPSAGGNIASYRLRCALFGQRALQLSL